MHQFYELKLLSSVGEVLGLLTAIITLGNYLTNPFPPKVLLRAKGKMMAMISSGNDIVIFFGRRRDIEEESRTER